MANLNEPVSPWDFVNPALLGSWVPPAERIDMSDLEWLEREVESIDGINLH